MTTPPLVLRFRGAFQRSDTLARLAHVRAVCGVEDRFDHWHTSLWIKAVFGGLIVGLMGAFGRAA